MSPLKLARHYQQGRLLYILNLISTYINCADATTISCRKHGTCHCRSSLLDQALNRSVQATWNYWIGLVQFLVYRSNSVCLCVDCRQAPLLPISPSVDAEMEYRFPQTANFTKFGNIFSPTERIPCVILKNFQDIWWFHVGLMLFHLTGVPEQV